MNSQTTLAEFFITLSSKLIIDVTTDHDVDKYSNFPPRKERTQLTL